MLITNNYLLLIANLTKLNFDIKMKNKENDNDNN